MKTKFIVLIATLFAACPAFSQEPVSMQEENEIELWGFLFPEFMEGSILMNDRSKINAPLNYDAVYEHLISRSNEGAYIIVHTNDVTIATIGERVFVPVNKNLFYEEVPLDDGRRLYVRNKLTYRIVPKDGNIAVSETGAVQNIGYAIITRGNAKPNAGGQQASGSYTFGAARNRVEINESMYYLRMPDRKFKIITSAKRLARLFPEYREEILSYSKKNDIDFRNIDDVKQIVEYCYSL